MRSLVVFGAKGARETSSDSAVLIESMLVESAILHLPEPVFDARRPAFANFVLVHVHAFSCNYRDKGFIAALQLAPPNAFFAIGSELVATVVEVGSAVQTVSVGDRVIGQNHYESLAIGADGVSDGVPTNQASKEYLILHEKKIIAIPDNMTNSVAAGFSIGAQTAYSMVRRLSPKPFSKVLVPSATSNTSLFLIAALRQRNVIVYASTTARIFDDQLLRAGASYVIQAAVSGAEADDNPTELLSREIGGFDCVFDPFFDLHLEQASRVLAPFGTYITCGLAAQTPTAPRQSRPIPAEYVLAQAVMKNLSIVGNCLGTRDDLVRALADYAHGTMDYPLDSIYSDDRTSEFLARTYTDRRRFGKVIFEY